MIVAGGGVLYAGRRGGVLQSLRPGTASPWLKTQAGKGTMPQGHAMAMGAIGVTGTSAANELARAADVVLAIGTRLQDFTTGFAQPVRKPCHAS